MNAYMTKYNVKYEREVRKSHSIRKISAPDKFSNYELSIIKKSHIYR